MMPVSSGLQKYFDSQKKKKGDMQDSLAKLKDQISPEFLQSFEAFHDRIINIVDENPQAEEIVANELEDLSHNLGERKRVHQTKKAAKIIDIAA